MSFFRRKDEPSARESFLISALTASGFTVEQINDAQTANATDFLNALDKSGDVSAALAAANGTASNLNAAITGAGFKIEDAASAESFAAAYKTRLESEAARLAVEISASRAIAPVAQAASASSEKPSVTREKFDAMSHSERNTFMRSGGKIEG